MTLHGQKDGKQMISYKMSYAYRIMQGILTINTCEVRSQFLQRNQSKHRKQMPWREMHPIPINIICHQTENGVIYKIGETKETA